MIARVLAALVLLSAVSARAQEFDVFDLTDFVNPMLRDAAFDEHGAMQRPGRLFTVVRGVTGAISDYAWRSTPTHDNVGFVSLSANRYFSDKQAGIKLTMLDPRHDEALPRYRIAAQFGKYTSRKANTKVEEDGLAWLADRMLVTLGVEENRIRGELGSRRRVNLEVGVQYDLAMPIPGGRNASGSLIWMTRSGARRVTRVVPVDVSSPFIYRVELLQPRRTQRVGYYYQFDERPVAERLRVNLDFDIGGERTDKWHWGATRLGVRGSLDIGAAGTLNAAWTSTFVPHDADQNNRRQEVAIFVDRTLFAKLRH